MTLASQKVARTPELIGIIIEQVLAGTSNLARNDELRSLMIVSRSFSSVALDTLWENQTSLVPLFLTLRPVARLFRLKDETRTLRFEPGSRSPPWKRFYSYARRVKVLDDSQANDNLRRCDITLHPSLFQGLDPKSTILPRLQTLRLHSRVGNSLHRAITLHVPTSATDTRLLFARRDLEGKDKKSIILGALCDVRSLRCLGGQYVPQSAHWLETRGPLPNLHTFEAFRSNEIHRDYKLPTYPSAGNFSPSIVRLVQPSSVVDAARTLGSLPRTKMRASVTALEINVPHDADNMKRIGSYEQTVDLYREIQAYCGPSTLTHLCVFTGYAFSGLLFRASSLFADLLVFKNMEHLDIVFCYRHANLEDAIDTFSFAFPRLKFLSLVIERPERSNAKNYLALPTFDALLPLVRRCPLLEYVRLPLRVGWSWYSDKSLPKSVAVRPLTLNVMPSASLFEPLEQSFASSVASILRKLFPGLRRIEGFWSGRTDLHWQSGQLDLPENFALTKENWEEVEDIVANRMLRRLSRWNI